MESIDLFSSNTLHVQKLLFNEILEADVYSITVYIHYIYNHSSKVNGTTKCDCMDVSYWLRAAEALQQIVLNENFFITNLRFHNFKISNEQLNTFPLNISFCFSTNVIGSVNVK